MKHLNRTGQKDTYGPLLQVIDVSKRRFHLRHQGRSSVTCIEAWLGALRMPLDSRRCRRLEYDSKNQLIHDATASAPKIPRSVSKVYKPWCEAVQRLQMLLVTIEELCLLRLFETLKVG